MHALHKAGSCIILAHLFSYFSCDSSQIFWYCSRSHLFLVDLSSSRFLFHSSSSAGPYNEESGVLDGECVLSEGVLDPAGENSSCSGVLGVLAQH